MADENTPAGTGGDAGSTVPSLDMALGVPDNGVPIITPASLQASATPSDAATFHIKEPDAP